MEKYKMFSFFPIFLYIVRRTGKWHARFDVFFFIFILSLAYINLLFYLLERLSFPLAHGGAKDNELERDGVVVIPV